jgi:hypothetical protein
LAGEAARETRKTVTAVFADLVESGVAPAGRKTRSVPGSVVIAELI